MDCLIMKVLDKVQVYFVCMLNEFESRCTYVLNILPWCVFCDICGTAREFDEQIECLYIAVNKGQISSIQNGVAEVDCGNDKPISCRSLRPGRDISGGTERNYFPRSSRCTATMSNQTEQFDLRTSHQWKVPSTSTCKVPTRSLH